MFSTHTIFFLSCCCRRNGTSFLVLSNSFRSVLSMAGHCKRWLFLGPPIAQSRNESHGGNPTGKAKVRRRIASKMQYTTCMVIESNLGQRFYGCGQDELMCASCRSRPRTAAFSLAFAWEVPTPPTLRLRQQQQCSAVDYRAAARLCSRHTWSRAGCTAAPRRRCAETCCSYTRPVPRPQHTRRPTTRSGTAAHLAARAAQAVLVLRTDRAPRARAECAAPYAPGSTADATRPRLRLTTPTACSAAQ